MKQLLFLLLFPCLALAQYPANGNQKISLGEQTTADGLVYRGIRADTASKIVPFSDTSAYIILDTVEKTLWLYMAGQVPKWQQVGGSAGGGGGVDSTAIKYVNTYGTQTVNGAKTFTSAVTATRFNPTASTATGTGMFAPTSTSLGFSTNGTNKMTLDASGNLGIGVTPSAWNTVKAIQVNAAFIGSNSSTGYNGANCYYQNDWKYVNSSYSAKYDMNASDLGKHKWFTAPSGIAGNTINFTEIMILDNNGNLGLNEPTPTEKLHVVGNARITAVGSGTFANNLNITSNGTLTTATSDEKYKYNILPINYGLNTILQLKPVNFQWIKGEENDLGFIAQDVADIIPEAVDTNWNSDLLMRYESIIPILTKAIQEQQALIKALEQRILILENK